MKQRLALGLASLIALIPALATISPVSVQAAASVRSVLSATGQAYYDSATAGSYFPVSSVDFASAQANLSSVTKLGMTDAQLTGCNGTWSANGALVYNNTITIPANAYILGYAIALASGVGTNGSARLIASTTYKGSYDFLVTSNYPKSSPGVNYYLFKTPITSASTRYLGTWANVSQCSYYINSPSGGYAIQANAPFSAWTDYQSDFPAFQILYTTSDQWAPAPVTVSASLSGGVNKVSKGIPTTINTSLSYDGLVTFKYNGKNIGKCVNIKSISLAASCNWTPAIQGSGRLTATLKSIDSSFVTTTSTPLQISILKRTNTR